MLSKILEQFDEKFVASNIGKIYNWKATALISCTEVRRFISQSIEQALNEVMVRKIYDVVEVENASTGEIEELEEPLSRKGKGWNCCAEALEENIKNFLTN